MGRNGTRAFQKSRECGFLGALVSLISYDHVGVKKSKILMRASLHRISGLWTLVSTGSSWKLQAGLSLASVF